VSPIFVDILISILRLLCAYSKFCCCHLAQQTDILTPTLHSEFDNLYLVSLYFRFLFVLTVWQQQTKSSAVAEMAAQCYTITLFVLGGQHDWHLSFWLPGIVIPIMLKLYVFVCFAEINILLLHELGESVRVKFGQKRAVMKKFCKKTVIHGLYFVADTMGPA